MERKEYDLLLGRLAVHFKILSKEQVSDALQLRRKVDENLDFGSFLVSEEYLPPEVFQKLEKARRQYLEKNGLQPPAGVRVLSAPAPAPAPAAAPAPAPAAPEPAPAVPSPAASSLQLDTADGGDPTFQLSSAPSAAIAMPAPAAPSTPIAMPASVAPSAAIAMPAPATPSAPIAMLASPAAPAASGAAAALPTDSGDHKLSFQAGTTLHDLLQQAAKLGASDMHMHCQAPIRLRLHGAMDDASPVLNADQTEALIMGLLNDEQKQILEDRWQLDFSYEVEGVARFRANTYRQQKGLDAVFRIIPPRPPTLMQLGLPEDLERVIAFHQGMVLFTGPAGCGKSSTMAAMVRLINSSRPDHILTVEDPIEYIHPSIKCLVNQREVGHHTESFARALRAALREDPDIIVIGELRDLETIELALTAAETGHLVLGTLHTSSAIRTINRLLGVFPPEQQNQIRTMVSESLRAIVSQRLVPKADGSGRVAAIEVLMNNKAVGNLIREKKTFQIQSQMQTGSSQGMVLLDNSLQELVQSNVITQEEAFLNADDKKRFA